MALETKALGQHRSNACSACKRRRSRCRGDCPCDKCRELGTECVFQPQYDKRRKSAIRNARNEVNTLQSLVGKVVEAAEADDKKRIQELLARMKSQLQGSSQPNTIQQEPLNPSLLSKRIQADEEEESVTVPRKALTQLQEQYSKLYMIHEALRTCDPMSLPSIINQIRRGSATHDCVPIGDRLIHQHKPGITLERDYYGSLSSIVAEDFGPLHKEPLYRVSSIEKWTKVVSDEVASHLFSIYFSWETWHLVEPDLFIQDLNAGAIEFCSSLLVNAVLCFACNYSLYAERPWGRQEEITTANKLLAEVERLWVVERRNCCLTTVQSSLIIGLLFNASGKDKVGSTYIEYGIRMAEKFGLHKVSPSISRNSRHPETDVKRALKVIAWSAFEVQGITTQLCRTKPMWPEPPGACFSEDEARIADENLLWTPYPFTSPAYEHFKYTLIWASENQLAVANEIADFAVSLPDGPLAQKYWTAGAKLYDQLVASHASRPSVFQLRRNKTPRNICLHLHYYATIINLCELFDSRPLDASCVESRKDLESFNPYQNLLDAMDAMGSLILLYRECHGWDYLPCIMEHYFCVVGVHAAAMLCTSEHWLEVLSACVSGLWHMSRPWRLARPLLRTINFVMKSASESLSLLPMDILNILQQFEGKMWNNEELSSLSANYVVHQVPDRLSARNKLVHRSKAEGIEELILTLENVKI